MRLKKRMKAVIVIMLLQIILTACAHIGILGERTYRIIDVEIYKDTPAWELAKAVNRQDVKKIARIAQETPELLDYQDPTHGTNLLCWAVGVEKYKSVEALLKGGADPDIISEYSGGTALYSAAGYSRIDSQAKKDPKYVELLLEYGADPNIGYVGNERDNSTEIGRTPLMNSISCGIGKTKALVEGGADINYQTETGRTAAFMALMRGGPNVTLEGMEYAHYLIVEKKADITIPWILESGEVVPLVSLLRDWIDEIDSAEHRIKMEIVEEFARQGEDYWATEISERNLEIIKKRFPDTWEEYIKVY